MKSNYKRLGSYIKEINVRNADLNVNNLLGINIDKFFMPSVANIVGTDLSKYKIVKNGQFACNRMHVGRDKRLPVALSKLEDDVIVSPAYDVFEIIDREAMDPEYLMMWFSRKEFDRNAWFYTDADVRGGLSWKDFCNMQLPVPTITKQKEIVKEYNVFVDRKKLNTSIIQKLEEAAQIIYRQWFIEFEFPDETGKPYKSNGGEMEFNKELEMEIPKGWGSLPVYEVANFINGASFRENDFSIDNKGLPIIKIVELKKGINSDTSYTTKKIDPKYKIRDGDILYSWSGNPETSLEVFKWFGGEAWLNQHIFKVDFKQTQSKLFVYFLLKHLKPVFIQLAEGKQTTGLGHITVSDLKKLIIAYPTIEILKKFEESISSIYNCDSIFKVQNIKLSELIDILMSRLTTMEDNQ